MQMTNRFTLSIGLRRRRRRTKIHSTVTPSPSLLPHTMKQAVEKKNGSDHY